MCNVTTAEECHAAQKSRPRLRVQARKEGSVIAHILFATYAQDFRGGVQPAATRLLSILEISQQAEIGIDDFFRMLSIRTIELALSGSSENEAYSVKSRAKDFAKKSLLSLFLRCACACVFLPPFFSLQHAAAAAA